MPTRPQCCQTNSPDEEECNNTDAGIHQPKTEKASAGDIFLTTPRKVFVFGLATPDSKPRFRSADFRPTLPLRDPPKDIKPLSFLRKSPVSPSSIILPSLPTPESTPTRNRSTPPMEEAEVMLGSFTPPEAISSVAEVSDTSRQAAESQTKSEIPKLVYKVPCNGTNSDRNPCGNWVLPSDRYCDHHLHQDTGFRPANVKEPQWQPRDTDEDIAKLEETQKIQIQCRGNIEKEQRRQCKNWVFPADRYCGHHRGQDTRSRVSSAKVEGPQRQSTRISCPTSEPSRPPPSHFSQRPRLSWARRVWNALISPPHQPPAHDYISLNSSQHAPTQTATQPAQEEYDYGCSCLVFCCTPRRRAFSEAQ